MKMRNRKRRSCLLGIAVMAGSALPGPGVVFARTAETGPAADAGSLPEDANYACPMEAHPDQAKPEEQGAYFASEPGKCPWCGMKLKPVEELGWVQARKAAGGADVAFTCPDHQHVFSKTSGECPRCGRNLKPFKVMYTCPDPQHAHVIAASKGKCAVCGRNLAPFRGLWLDETMAQANVPPSTQPAADAPYRCPLHPLVHSAKPGSCTICAKPLTPGGGPAGEVAEAGADHVEHRHPPGLPAGTKYVCPMKECEAFSATKGRCPECGMKLKPVEEVAWARDLRAQTSRPAEAAYICPMHPQEKSDSAGACPICAMQLVRADLHDEPREAPEQVQQELNHIAEHYLELQRLLASDRSTETAKHALGIASASEELLNHLARAELSSEDKIRKSVKQLQSAALKINGSQITDDRLHFVGLSTAMSSLLENLRPDRSRWPELYVYHCPMSKGDWIQADKEKRNPYYGFQMLKCGELKATK